MITTHEYRIYPSPEQITRMAQWLELLRRHWNYALGQQLDGLNRTREAINAYSIISEPIGDIPEPVNYYSQQGDLKETKVLFPEYKEIYTEVQQGNLRRLDKAWQRWRKPDETGKRAGRPRFKKVGKLRSFTFSQVNSSKAGVHAQGERIRFSRIGERRIRLHRPGTSQDCSGCNATVPKTLSVRTHQCPHCGLEIDRDENAAINILQRALCEVGNILPAWVGFDVGRPMKQDAQAAVGIQLSLLA